MRVISVVAVGAAIFHGVVESNHAGFTGTGTTVSGGPNLDHLDLVTGG